ncbi:DENN domain-containing protein Crag isoform X2 [Rhynchophorus ferrugineus]|uniref:DENN domain-containing protein Crag isoform X2 n=1 Tax=Rhynchophorus ferrugineus TaxID=354439 RepID=UPI003FCD43D6
MDERRLADYFVVAGLPEDPELLDDTTLSEGGNLKACYSQSPITDVSVIFPNSGETAPDDWEVIRKTPSGLIANLNHGSLRTPDCFLCIRRGRDKPPLVDIGIMYEGKEYLMTDAELVETSLGGSPANVNNSTSQTFITYRRGSPTMPCNALVVTDICVVIASKGESPPHAFCCIYKNLNKGIVGSDVFLCYKKSMNRAKLLTYKPDVLARYPIGDIQEFPFPNSVPLFCLPMGATLELWRVEASRPRPVFSNFVLTVSDAKHKVYGSALTFYEKYPEENITDEQRELLGFTEESNDVLHVNKSICILSHWPFSEEFQSWLIYLYHKVTEGKPNTIPVERYITQLLDEVPFPSPRTLLQLSGDNQDERVIFIQPEDLPLPRSAASFKQLLFNLGPENCLQVLQLALTEQKILIHSLRPDVLTAVAEAVSSLLFPFKWQCPYIPLCPLGLVEVLHAPLPFLIGVDSRFFDLYDPPWDVSCIDLDTNVITVAESQRANINTKLLPKKAAKHLKTTLEALQKDLRNVSNSNFDVSSDNIEEAFKKKKKEHSEELEIQEAFLKFMVNILKGYRSYLLPIIKAPTVGTTDTRALFQLNEFLKSRDKNHTKFFSLVTKTQMFIRFIEERSFVVDQDDQGLTFFDDCIEKLSAEDYSIRLIELESVHKSDRTVFVLPPQKVNDHDTYEYSHFSLNPLLLRSDKTKNELPNFYQTVLPGSPMARRTKHEIKSAQKLARKYQRSPENWARCLCGTCHTLYFMILPSMLSLNVGKEKAILQQANELLVRTICSKLPCDEVCYRLMMQLCSEHNRPLLAVNLLILMKKNDIQPNALTYGLYNKCVLEAQWPAHSGSSLLWNKLRNVVLGVTQFKLAAKRKVSKYYLSASTEGGSNLLDTGSASRSSLDSHEGTAENSFLDRFKRVVKNSIVKNSFKESEEPDGLNGTEEEEKTTEHSLFVQNIPSEFRILSRSESAGDANIIDKLQNTTKKTCSRTLQFQKKNSVDIMENDKNSPSKISPREVITENDPLGAFNQPTEEPPKNPSNETHSVPSSDTNPVLSDEPVLFRNSVQRSATFEGSPPSQSKLHRSETTPAVTMTSSLANIGSSLKISFSRYTTQRLSLKKANLKVPQQLFETALTNLSPGLTSKKSNEIIQGSLSTIKSAASTMVKKMEEIKEAISTSATSTPVKNALTAADRMASGDALNDVDGDSVHGSDDAGLERQRKVSAELGSHRGSSANLKDYDELLPENLYSTPEETKGESEMDITLTTCSQCHNCNQLLYDEDIMANWSAEDSNLNTLCQSCNKPTVPLLTITVTGKEILNCDPFSVPYLNPLVLRKELENILTQEGDLSIADPKFIDEHPIIYWNLVWVFERINVNSHLPHLYLKNRVHGSSSLETDKKELENDSNALAKPEEDNQSNCSSMKLVEEGTDPLTQELAALERLAAKVRVKCLWDEPKFHIDGPPMYILWRLRDSTQIMSSDRSKVTKSFMQQILNYIRISDLVEPIKSLVEERKDNDQRTTKNSIYRDVLFLACKALGRSQIDINAFDKEYTTAYSRYSEKNHLESQDKPISLSSLYCRQYFRPLLLP